MSPIRLSAKKLKGKAWKALLAKKTSDTVIVPKGKKPAKKEQR